MTRTKGKQIETHTIQVWPGGASYTYRGNPDGPPNQRSLKAGYYQPSIRCEADCRRLTAERGGTTYLAGYGDTHIPLSDDRVGAYCIVTDKPGGIAGFEIQVCPTCKGAGYVSNPVKNPWRKGTADEWRSIRIELRAEMFWSRDGMGCDSALVDDLIKSANSGDRYVKDLADGFGYEEIRNLYRDPSNWTADECREYASDHGIDLPDIPMTECPECHGEPLPDGPNVATTTCGHCTSKGEEPEDGYEEDDSPRGWLSEAREACQEHAQDNPAEVYEWWRVSSWLCDKLHEHGEVTIDNGYGHWWGRTCTGQNLLMDGTLQAIAAKFID